MKYKFSGHITEPEHFNNVGVLILDIGEDRTELAKKLAEWGCLCIILEASHLQKDPDTVQKSIQSALHFLYRYSEKLVIIGFREGGYLGLQAAETYDNLDCLLYFDPYMYNTNFSELTKMPLIIRFFADPNNEKVMETITSYQSAISQTDRDYKIITYTPSQLDIVQDSVLESNNILDEIFKIVQFI
jgi:dienelactone hydrolase